MQPTVSSFLTPLALKTAGIVTILVSLSDLIFTLWFPPENPYKSILDVTQWWFLHASSQIVDRGLLPLVGISFVVAGDWIKIVSTEDGGNRGNGWRVGTFTLASLLGLIFILIIPFQAIATSDIKTQALKTLTTEVVQREQAIKGDTQQIASQSKEKIKEELTAIDKELKSGVAQPNRIPMLQIAKYKRELFLTDPQKFTQESQLALQQLPKQKQELETKINERMLQTGVKTGVASLLLAIAYITIGWTGLRRVLR
jgi:hypothetical protein